METDHYIGAKNADSSDIRSTMRVGIITFHYPCNYGAVLQCLALYRTIKSLGHEVDVVRYVPEGYRDYFPLWKGWGVRNGFEWRKISQRAIAYRHGPKMRRKFDQFLSQHFTFSPPCATMKEVGEVVQQYDALVTGSDQVWHFAQKAPFFLEFGAPYAGRRISYAPCCGHAEQPQYQIAQIKEWLSNVDYISVRNDFSKKLVGELVDRDIPVVADPTLLADLADVQQSVELPFSEYILTYTLGGEIQGGNRAALAEIKKVHGDLPVVAVVPSAHKQQLAPWADHTVWTAGPSEWLWLITHATFVFTDSFHGVLFSLKHNRPFLSYYAEKGRAPRLVDLALRYQIEDCIVENNKEVCQKMAKGFERETAIQLIRTQAEESLCFLRKALA